MSGRFSHENNSITDLGVPSIGLSQGQPITREADIERFVEEPAREACIDLFQKNVLTVSASAHDGEPTPYIDIDRESMSEANKTVLDDLIEKGQAEMIKIKVDGKTVTTSFAKIKADNLGDQRTSEEISRALLDITRDFEVQPLTRGFYTLEALKEISGYAPEEDPPVQEFIADGYVLDEPTGLLFLSKELIDQYRIGIAKQ